jgi:hypothetical protein
MYSSTAQYIIMYHDSTSAGYSVHIDYAKMHFTPPPPRFEEILDLLEDRKTFTTAGTKQKKTQDTDENIHDN